MGQWTQNRPWNAILQSIILALEASYGDLSQPNFRKIYTKIEEPAYRQVAENLRSEGIQVSNSTKLNTDVAIHLDVEQGKQDGLVALSGVGLFAAFIWHSIDGQPCWVTQSESAPSALAACIARIVEGAGFTLLDRNTVLQSVDMNRADGTTKATLYQALFTDSDVIP